MHDSATTMFIISYDSVGWNGINGVRAVYTVYTSPHVSVGLAQARPNNRDVHPIKKRMVYGRPSV